VYRVTATDLSDAVSEAIVLVDQLVTKDAGRLPGLVVRELLGNLVHAGADGAVVSVLDSGHTLRVSDRGPGIRDKERAQLPGFTTAGPDLGATIRGVGSGLGLVRESLSSLGGHLEIDDNLGGGTVVTARVPDSAADDVAAEGPERFQLTERQLRSLLLIVELGPVGPTPLARELGVSASTAYRDLVSLEEAGLIAVEGRGSRTVSDEGLAYLKTVL
jgi:DNA-binding transcriptional ArsR family regulator